MAKRTKVTKARQAALSAYKAQRSRITSWAKRQERKGIILDNKPEMPTARSLKTVSTQKIKSMTATLKTLTPSKLLKRSVYVNTETGEIENASARRYRQWKEKNAERKAARQRTRSINKLKTGSILKGKIAETSKDNENVKPKRKTATSETETDRNLESIQAWVNRARSGNNANPETLDVLDELIQEARDNGNLSPDVSFADLTVATYESDKTEVETAISRLTTALLDRPISASESETMNA